MLAAPEKVRKDMADHGMAELIVEPTPDACGACNQLHRFVAKAQAV